MSTVTIDTQHSESIHDSVLDYYSTRLATCSSDKTIKIFNIVNGTSQLMETLRGHEGPVWQVSWAHPKFGTILASSGYDGKIIIWRESTPTGWSKLTEHVLHSASVNSISWAPHELGAILVAGSSDGKISVLEFKDDGSWDTTSFAGHGVGVNSVSWAPSTVPYSLVSTTPVTANEQLQKKFVSGGCDNLLKIWSYEQRTGAWVCENELQGHSDWVRDVSWAPNLGLSKSYIASGSQDKTVQIWTSQPKSGEWEKTELKQGGFADVVWRVSWSESGNLLAISCGDGKIYLWKETVGGWEEVETIAQ